MHPPKLSELVQATRTDLSGQEHIETRHTGAIVVVAGDGAVVASTGDMNLTTPLRSTAKPFQLLPFLLDGLHREMPHWGSSEALADLAVMMSSHNGESMHTTRIGKILSRNALETTHLKCGAHEPMHSQTYHDLLRAGQSFDALHCNCSGKHTNMLLVCQSRGWPLDTYLEPEHPLQVRIRNIISELSGVPAQDLPAAVDGCSLPTFVLSLRTLARLFACLAWPQSAPDVENTNSTELLKLLFDAATTHPRLIAGTNRLDTELMELLSQNVFAKTGAAGVYAMAVRPGRKFPTGLGVAIKVVDGDVDSRVRRVAAVETLRQLEIDAVTAVEPHQLSELSNISLRNFKQLEIGKLVPTFNLIGSENVAPPPCA